MCFQLKQWAGPKQTTYFFVQQIPEETLCCSAKYIDTRYTAKFKTGETIRQFGAQP